MKEYILTVNADYDDISCEGCNAKVLAWDRDKRYTVKLLEGPYKGLIFQLKPYWLDNNAVLFGSYQHMAIYKLPSNIEKPESRKERYLEYKRRVRRLTSSFTVKVGNALFSNLTRKQVRSKVRYALQTNQSFDIDFDIKDKWSSPSGLLAEYSAEDATYCIYERNLKEVSKKTSGFQRNLEKLILSY